MVDNNDNVGQMDDQNLGIFSFQTRKTDAS